MKRKSLSRLPVFVAAVALAVGLSACDTTVEEKPSPSVANAPDNATLTPVTLSSLVGVWMKEKTEEDSWNGHDGMFRDRTYVSINGDHDFLWIDMNLFESDDDEYDYSFYSYYLGKVSLDGNILAFDYEYEYLASAPVEDFDSINWSAFSRGEGSTVAMQGDTLFTAGVFERVGTGTGLVGSWHNDQLEHEDGETYDSYRNFIITESTLTVSGYYADDDEEYANPAMELTLTAPGILAYSFEGNSQSLPYLLGGNLLVLGDIPGYRRSGEALEVPPFPAD